MLEAASLDSLSLRKYLSLKMEISTSSCAKFNCHLRASDDIILAIGCIISV